MIAEEIMTADPMTATEDQSLSEILSVFADHGVRHLPILREGELVGMLSDRDVRDLGLWTSEGVDTNEAIRKIQTTTVASIMNGPVTTVDSDAELTDIVDLLLEEKVGAIPVVEAGRTGHLVGIISYVDVLRAARGLFG